MMDLHIIELLILIKKEYLLRRDLLLLEQELGWLQKTAKLYVERKGEKAQHLKDFVAEGLLKSIPDKDPLGGKYFIDAEGKIATTSEDNRLRLEDRVKRELKMVRQ